MTNQSIFQHSHAERGCPQQSNCVSQFVKAKLSIKLNSNFGPIQFQIKLYEFRLFPTQILIFTSSNDFTRLFQMILSFQCTDLQIIMICEDRYDILIQYIILVWYHWYIRYLLLLFLFHYNYITIHHILMLYVN